MHIRDNFIRNIYIEDLLETFFVSGVASILFIRFSLYLTGYWHLGGGGLHIVYIFHGGILMLVALVLLLSFLGNRILKIAYKP